MRFTKTWSPISSVFSIELDGISNACTTNVMMNNPVPNTAASDERNSTVDSLGFSSATLSSTTTDTSFFADFFSVIIDKKSAKKEVSVVVEDNGYFLLRR